MQNLRISIHALLAESDQAANGLANAPPEISIHALLAESDAHTAKNTSIAGHFYPRSPCGERLTLIALSTQPTRFLSTLSLRRATVVNNIIFVPGKFLSTLSLRRATTKSDQGANSRKISIHALLAESDSQGADSWH